MVIEVYNYSLPFLKGDRLNLKKSTEMIFNIISLNGFGLKISLDKIKETFYVNALICLR